jgi:hypothetical protein
MVVVNFRQKPFSFLSLQWSLGMKNYFNPMVNGPDGIGYDIGTKSRFLLMMECAQALRVFFNVGY